MYPFGTYPGNQFAQQNYSNSRPNLIFVDGLDMANNWPVPAGTSAIMMDSQNPVLYIKSVDMTGRVLPLEIYDLKKREPNPEEAYVTKSEMKSLLDEYFGNRWFNKNYKDSGKSYGKYRKNKKEESEEEE